MIYPIPPEDYAELYRQWASQFMLMLKLAECFCGKCVVCTSIRPSVLVSNLPPEADETEEDSFGEYDDEEDFNND